MSKVSTVFYVIGVLFNLLGAFGLLRLPDIYNRLQAATKCVTLGTCMILLGVFIDFGLSGLGTKAGGEEYLLHFMDPRVVTENTARRGFSPDLLL